MCIIFIVIVSILLLSLFFLLLGNASTNIILIVIIIISSIIVVTSNIIATILIIRGSISFLAGSSPGSTASVSLQLAVVRGDVRGVAHGPPSALGPAARCQPVSKPTAQEGCYLGSRRRQRRWAAERAEGVSVGAASHKTDATAGVWVRYTDVGGGHSDGVSAAGRRYGLTR